MESHLLRLLLLVSKIGSRLRQWVEKLHGGSINCPIDVDTKLGGNPLAKDIYRYSYRNLPSALQKVRAHASALFIIHQFPEPYC